MKKICNFLVNPARNGSLSKLDNFEGQFWRADDVARDFVETSFFIIIYHFLASLFKKRVPIIFTPPPPLPNKKWYL